MKITAHTIGGRYREICFHDFEDESVRACSGALDENEALELSWQLREIADKLTESGVQDRSQILLPFVLDHAA